MQKLHSLQQAFSQPVDCDVCWLIGALIVIRVLCEQGLYACPLCLVSNQSAQWQKLSTCTRQLLQVDIDALVVTSAGLADLFSSSICTTAVPASHKYLALPTATAAGV
jgi:hypothetical protein